MKLSFYLLTFICRSVEVHKGDTYFVLSGTVNGIGKGILVAEIQESSNVTYRVYDYNRVDKNGKSVNCTLIRQFRLWI